MIQHYTFAVLGGDKRMVYAAELLAMTGFSVIGYGLSERPSTPIHIAQNAEEALRADFFLLPIPMSRDEKTLFAPALAKPLEIEKILEKAPSHAVIFGSNTKGFSDPRLLDYGKRSDFATQNAQPTAEGALLLAIQQLPCAVNGARVGIVGFGKIGKATAALFHAVGAKVTVFARREEVCSVASLLGYCSAPLAELSEYVSDFRCLINTAPAPVIGDAALSRMRRDALLLELASPPYGIDFAIAEKQELHTILASGLPGKYAPETAGHIICKTILTMLSEKGISI
jgi:dipicolinate synthase subunit A